MPAPIPSDLLREFRREISTRWPDFLGGRALQFHNLTLRKEKTGRIVVGCFSEKYFSENLSEVEARDRIATAKDEVQLLIEAFPEIRDELSRAKVDFEFCYDGGKSAHLVAKESDG